METFSQLLNQYIQRAGISDAELARSIGLRRQTIFRWREGLTARPRYRNDVLKLARKLRLSPAEQDALLIAAGFPPETPPAPQNLPDEELSALAEIPFQNALQDVEGQIVIPSQKKARQTARWLAIGTILILLIAMAWSVWLFMSRTSARKNVILPAQPGETLIITAQFINYAGGERGYNVAGRINEALQSEIEALGLPDIRLAIWPATVDSAETALRVGRQLGASLVIYGEYDAGRVAVNFALPAQTEAVSGPNLQRQVSSLQDLSAVINTDLPQQTRSLAWLSLGQIFLTQGNIEQARPLLLEAVNTLENDPAAEGKTQAVANFYLGIALQESAPPQFDKAINAYSKALSLWPEMISSRLNRSAAYQLRGQGDDLTLALLDADVAVKLAPDWPAAYNNRASVKIRLGGSENNLSALQDLDTALSLNPNLASAYFNRAYLAFEQGQTGPAWEGDLLQALSLRPDHVGTLNQLCWNYALEGQPKKALPHCNRLIELDPNPEHFDSRGVALALNGDYAGAIADFEVYIDWLNEQTEAKEKTILTQRQNWLEALQQGQNPFSAEVLLQLRTME